MAKGDHLRKHGMFSEWDSYRYGNKQKVSLAPVWKKTERKRVISRVFDILKDWKVTPFEMEGPVRAGIRSALCLQGEGWYVADNAAASSLVAAYQKMGVSRPTWDQGQREFTTPEENCLCCGMLVPDELATGRTKSRYCSDVCAKSALVKREFETRRTSDAAYLNAYLTIQRMKHGVKACKQCGVLFRPLFDGGEFCSHSCATSHNRRLTNISCAECGVVFRPKNSAIKYCSRACSAKRRQTGQVYQCAQCGTQYRRRTVKELSTFCSRDCQSAAMRVAQYTKHCRCCGFQFETRSKKSLYCSNACSIRSRRNIGPDRVAPFVPLYALTPAIFDSWFKRAA